MRAHFECSPSPLTQDKVAQVLQRAVEAGTLPVEGLSEVFFAWAKSVLVAEGPSSSSSSSPFTPESTEAALAVLAKCARAYFETGTLRVVRWRQRNQGPRTQTQTIFFLGLSFSLSLSFLSSFFLPCVLAADFRIG